MNMRFRLRWLALAGMVLLGLGMAPRTPGCTWPCATNWCELDECLSPAYETFGGIYLSPGTNFCLGSDVYAWPEPYPYSQFCGEARLVVLYSPPSTNCEPYYFTNSFCPMSKTNWCEVTGPGFQMVTNQLWIVFTPTNCGDYMVSFHEVWTNPPPCGYGATCGAGGSISISTNFTVVNIEITPHSTNGVINRCQNPDNNVVFCLTNSCYPGGVTWTLDPANVPDGANLSVNGACATVSMGDVETNYTIRAVSNANTNCQDSATLPVMLDCDCSHHTISTNLVDVGIGQSCAPSDGWTNAPLPNPPGPCSDTVQLTCTGRLNYYHKNELVGYCPYPPPTDVGIAYWPCICGAVIMKTGFIVTATTANPIIGKWSIWECGIPLTNWCFTVVGTNRITRACGQGD